MPVDALRYRLADINIVKRLERVRHAEVEDVRLRFVQQHEIWISLDGCEVLNTREGHAVRARARLQLEQPAGALCCPLQHRCGVRCHRAVIGIVAGVDHGIATDPFLERIGASTDWVVQWRTARCLEVFFRLDAEDAECDRRQEGTQWSTENKLDCEFIHCRDGVDPTVVALSVAAALIGEDLAFEGRIRRRGGLRRINGSLGGCRCLGCGCVVSGSARRRYKSERKRKH